MSDKVDQRVEVAAIEALVAWKTHFAEAVVAEARRIAAASGQPNLITLSHYQQAARIAVRSLAMNLTNGEMGRENPEAA